VVAIVSVIEGVSIIEGVILVISVVEGTLVLGYTK
jgi:hypothetical protein